MTEEDLKAENLITSELKQQADESCLSITHDNEYTQQALREIYKAGYIAGGLGVIQAEVGSRLNSALGAMSRGERRKVMRAVKK